VNGNLRCFPHFRPDGSRRTASSDRLKRCSVRVAFAIGREAYCYPIATRR
jgi:hypothetical protein